ncbi:MAG: protease inhibitor Inh/omp19 family protein [Methylobacterium mesophilicum]|nr:protease inhibitor Inh/omp19 family protein [Methylobacterium mesophilicum]
MAFSRGRSGLTRGGIGLALALVLTGCNSARMASVDTGPAPLTPVPAGTVTGNSLPPPSAPMPPAPAAPNPQVAALPPANAPAANAPDLTPSTVAGVWSANVSGQSCRIATPQTKFGQGFRAGPLRCPAPVDGVKSWNVAGKQLTLYSDGGDPLARLYSSGPEKFDGQTTSGVPISLSR